MSDLNEDTVRNIVRDEIEIAPVIADIKQELHRQGIILENMESKFDSVIEMLTDNLSIKKQVDSHESRLHVLETDNDMVKTTVTLHSGQLARLQG